MNAEEAIAAAEKAVALAPGLAEAYSARSFTRSSLQWDWNGAREDIETALKLDPRSGGTQSRYGQLLACMGRIPEAIAAMLEVTKIEPLDINAWIALGWCYSAAGQFALGHRALSHALELSPGVYNGNLAPGRKRVSHGRDGEGAKDQ